MKSYRVTGTLVGNDGSSDFDLIIPADDPVDAIAAGIASAKAQKYSVMVTNVRAELYS